MGTANMMFGSQMCTTITYWLPELALVGNLPVRSVETVPVASSKVTVLNVAMLVRASLLFGASVMSWL